MTTYTIEICERMDDGRWMTCGRGILDHGQIRDCPADLEDAVYEALEAALTDGGVDPEVYVVADVGGREYRAEILSVTA